MIPLPAKQISLDSPFKYLNTKLESRKLVKWLLLNNLTADKRKLNFGSPLALVRYFFRSAGPLTFQ